MNELISLLLSIKTPLILGGLAVILFYLAIKIILKSDKIGTVGKTHSFKILTLVINKFFIIALVAIVLGFLGFVFEPEEPPPNVHLHGKVTDESGTPLRKVLVSVDGTRYKAISTSDGKFADTFVLKHLDNSVVIRAFLDGFQTFETTERISSQNHELNISLKKK